MEQKKILFGPVATFQCTAALGGAQVGLVLKNNAVPL